MSKVNDNLEHQDVDYETILNNLDIGFYKGEIQGKLIQHNSAFNKIFGYDPSESLVGVEARQFFIYPEEMKIYYNELREKDFAKNVVVNVKDINGDLKVVQLNSRLIRNEMGEPIEVEGTFVDITETQEIHQKLNEVKELYRLITDCEKGVIFTLDMNMKFTFISPEIYDLLGYTSDKMLNDTVTKYNTPSSLKIIADALKEEFKIEKMNIKPLNRVRTLEIQQIHKDGHIIDVEIVCTFLRDDDEKPIGIFGVTRDITERKKTERKLKESEHNLNERVKEITCLYGLSQLVENPDISLEDIIQGSLELIPPAWQFPEITCASIKYDNKIFKTDNYIETNWKLTTNLRINEKILEIKVYYLEDKPILEEEKLLINDIGNRLKSIIEQREGIQKLEESEKKLRLIFEGSYDLISITDSNAKTLWANPAWINIFGPVENYKELPLQLIHPENREKVTRSWNMLVSGEAEKIIIEYQYAIKPNVYKTFESSAFNLKIEGEKKFCVIARDITERRKAEQELKESEEKFRTITEQSLLGIAILQNGEVKYANEQILDLTGYTMDEIKGWGPQGFAKIIHHEDRSFVMKQAMKKQEGQKDVINRYEIRIIKKNEDILWVDNYSTTITFEGRLADLAILVDITQQKQLLNACEESEEKYRTIFDASPVGIGISNFDGSIVAANKRLHDILGYSLGDLENLDVNVTYEDINKRKQILNMLKESGIVNNFEVNLKKKDGTIFIGSLNMELLEIGKNKAIISNIEDITERKKTENNLIEINNFLNIVLDNTPILLAYLDSKFNFIRVNRVYAEADDHEVSFYPGKNHFDLFPYEENKEIFQRVVDTGEPYHILAKPFEYAEYPERGISYWDWSLIPIKGPDGAVGSLILSLQNVTEQVKSQKQIIDIAKFPSENPNPVLRVDEDKILYINEVGRRLFNITEGNNMPYILQEVVNTVIASNYSKIMELGLNDRIYSFNITLIQEEGYINIYGRDITEQKVSEEALKKVKEFTDNVLDTSIDTIFVFEPDTGRAIRWNEAFRIISGYTDDEIASLKAPNSYYNEEDLMKAVKAAQEALSTGVTTVEMSLLTKDGHSIPFEYTGRTFKSLDGDLLIVAVGRDITERKKVEAVLKESEKRYRGAYNRASFYKELIAHDMNNILQSIHSSVELYKLSKEKPDLFKDKKDFLSTITENVFRGSQIASNVIKLSDLEELKITLQLVDVNKNLMNAIVFIHKIYQTRKLNINVETLEEDRFALANDLILDLFENILLNSIKHNINPEIEIQTRITDIQLDNKLYCKIEFIDNGVGIPDERKEAIFHRREKNGSSSRGMGIGLSLVKQIVDSYNGKIWVEDRVKGDHTKGSNFVVLIPKTK